MKTVSIRRSATRWRSVFVGLTAALAVTAAAPAPQTTFNRTIRDLNHDNLLERGPGDRHVVRGVFAAPRSDRAGRRVLRISFAQFTDTHVVDEESPLRVEFVDRLGPPVNGAYRAQEGLSPQVMNEMVRQVRAAVSPVTGKGVALLIMTGDNSDNSQLNEVRWVIDLLDGGRRINPNSGVPGSCGLPATTRLYDGVRGSGVYYEPNLSSLPGAGVDGEGYAPTQTENAAEARRSNRVRDFPGLYEAMNKPFDAVGLGLPWYAVFGNHDALIQGNQPRNEALERLAVGCVKVRALSPPALAQLLVLLQGGLTSGEVGLAARLITDDMILTASTPALAATLAKTVPSDLRRLPLKKIEYMAAHFETRGRPVGHGFRGANLTSGMGNYSFIPKPGLRFVVLDSISELGNADGNIDHTQFQWIHRQLLAAESRRELVFAFAHHSLRTMNQPGAVTFPPGDIGGDASPLVHFGLGPNGAVASCPLTDPAAAPPLTETLRCLFLRHKSVIAFVDGHEHLNRIVPYKRTVAPGGGFWEVTTASHIDWPQQSRLLDLFDNRDGTLSLFGTMLDHTPNNLLGAVPKGPFVNAQGVAYLAAISREISFNDPQADNGENGHFDARGTSLDRNVELVLKNPYAPAP